MFACILYVSAAPNCGVQWWVYGHPFAAAKEANSGHVAWVFAVLLETAKLTKFHTALDLSFTAHASERCMDF